MTAHKLHYRVQAHLVYVLHTIVLNKVMIYDRKEIFMQDKNFDERLERFPLAMAYVPWQHITRVYDDLEEAFKTGTIFPELNKPFEGRRCVK